MLKYVDAVVSLAEIPDEISLCINISNCPCHCKGCHSSYLAEDIGKKLDHHVLEDLILSNEGISCISFMGGDADAKLIDFLASWVKSKYPSIKTAWYSGREYVSPHIDFNNFDYIKIGPYIEEKGPLDNPNTNQRFYKVNNYKLEDITYKFWKHEM